MTSLLPVLRRHLYPQGGTGGCRRFRQWFLSISLPVPLRTLQGGAPSISGRSRLLPSEAACLKVMRETNKGVTGNLFQFLTSSWIVLAVVAMLPKLVVLRARRVVLRAHRETQGWGPRRSGCRCLLPSRPVPWASVLRERPGLDPAMPPLACESPSTALASAARAPGSWRAHGRSQRLPTARSRGHRGQQPTSLAGGMGQGVGRGRLWWFSFVDCCVF